VNFQKNNSMEKRIGTIDEFINESINLSIHDKLKNNEKYLKIQNKLIKKLKEFWFPDVFEADVKKYVGDTLAIKNNKLYDFNDSFKYTVGETWKLNHKLIFKMIENELKHYKVL